MTNLERISADAHDIYEDAYLKLVRFTASGLCDEDYAACSWAERNLIAVNRQMRGMHCGNCYWTRTCDDKSQGADCPSYIYCSDAADNHGEDDTTPTAPPEGESWYITTEERP